MERADRTTRKSNEVAVGAAMGTIERSQRRLILAFDRTSPSPTRPPCSCPTRPAEVIRHIARDPVSPQPAPFARSTRRAPTARCYEQGLAQSLVYDSGRIAFTTLASASRTSVERLGHAASTTPSSATEETSPQGYLPQLCSCCAHCRVRPTTRFVRLSPASCTWGKRQLLLAVRLAPRRDRPSTNPVRPRYAPPPPPAASGSIPVAFTSERRSGVVRTYARRAPSQHHNSIGPRSPMMTSLNLRDGL